jgi:phosphoglycerol transferase
LTEQLDERAREGEGAEGPGSTDGPGSPDPDRPDEALEPEGPDEALEPDLELEPAGELTTKAETEPELEPEPEAESEPGRPPAPFGDAPAPGRLPLKLLSALAIGLVCSGLALSVFGFTSEETLRTPLAREDNYFYASIVRTLHDEGWYEPTQALGAPHGQQLLDFPMGDNHLHFLALRALTRFSSDPFVVLNVYLVASFGLIGAVTYLCLRSIGVEGWPAAVASILFAFLPYHFARAPYHAFLQAYYEVPLLLPVLKWALGGRLLRRRWLEWLLLAVVALVIGTTGVYYAAMLVILLAAAAVIDLVRTRRPWSLLRALGFGAAVAVVLVASFAPSIRYHRREGVNHELAQRVPREAEQFGLRPSLLLLPSPDHRIEALSELGKRAQEVQEPSEGPVSLGFVAGVGLVLCLGLGLVAMVRTGRGRPDLAAGFLGVLTFAAILVGAKGGLSYALALFGTKQLRTWSRISVFIGLFALAFLALRASAFRARVGRWVTGPVLVGVLVAGLLDQIPLDPGWRRYELAPQTVADRTFTRELEQALPAGAMVFQLPVGRFPEEPAAGQAFGYDELSFQILGTGKLRYSFGGLRGRQDQWQERWAGAGPGETMVTAAAVGFSAVVIDRFALDEQSEATEAELVRLLGPAVSDTSWRHRYAWYDLRPLRQRLEQAQPGQVDALGRVVANPPFLRWSGGGQARAFTLPVVRAMEPHARAEVSSPVPRRVRLEGVLIVPEAAEAQVRFDGQLVARVPEGEYPISVPLTLTKSKSELELELVDFWPLDRRKEPVLITRGLQLADPAADVVLDLARSWKEPPPPPPEQPAPPETAPPAG